MAGGGVPSPPRSECTEGKEVPQGGIGALREKRPCCREGKSNPRGRLFKKKKAYKRLYKAGGRDGKTQFKEESGRLPERETTSGTGRRGPVTFSRGEASWRRGDSGLVEGGRKATSLRIHSLPAFHRYIPQSQTCSLTKWIFLRR